uniref:EF-hand domain-containing protein n=1 Tax=Trieres chinensis TaxID=1514140 RepID=A0A7S2EM87_TRICV|mmetsp:Transcript_30355/g.61891  ORF Transcript_30355/g.61891 Transcript_30355/m.61891 type:complete len:169 (+) Transcript_30355:292-798(+)
MGVIDADGDGDVDFSEFLTGIGMMKQFCILSSQLDAAFRHYKSELAAKKRDHSLRDLAEDDASPQAREDGTAPKGRGLMRGLTTKFSSLKSQKKHTVTQEENEGSGGVELDASDLETFLSKSWDYAEEMVFLADQDDVEATVQEESEEVKADRTIDREEFQQLIRSWS